MCQSLIETVQDENMQLRRRIAALEQLVRERPSTATELSARNVIPYHYIHIHELTERLATARLSIHYEHLLRLQAEDDLCEHEAFFTFIIKHTPYAIAVYDRDLRYLLVNDHYIQAYHLDGHAIIGKRYDEVLPEQSVPWKEIYQRCLAGDVASAEDNTFLQSDGSLAHHRWECLPWHDTRGTIGGIITYTEISTERKQAEAALRKANVQLQHWVAELEERNREVTLLNEMSELLQLCLSVEEAYAIIGRSLPQLFVGQAGILYVLEAPCTQMQAVLTWGKLALSAPAVVPEACVALQRDPRNVILASDIGLFAQPPPPPPPTNACAPLIAQGETFGVLHVHVVTPEFYEHFKQLIGTVAGHLALALANLHLRERLREQAIRDALTGLFNRRYLQEALEREFQRALQSRHPVGIVMLDIDHFKRFNDTYGHDAGDALLIAVGAFLQAHSRDAGIACRYGGEEFTLILPNASLEATRDRAEELRAGVAQIAIQHQEYGPMTITVSVGVASFPQHGATIAEVVRCADGALRAAKIEGRDRVIVTEPLV